MDVAKALGGTSGIDATFGLQVGCPGWLGFGLQGWRRAERACSPLRAAALALYKMLQGEEWAAVRQRGLRCEVHVEAAQCACACSQPPPTWPTALPPSLPCRCKSRSTAAGADASRSTTATYSTSTTRRWVQQLLGLDGHAQGHVQPTPLRGRAWQPVLNGSSTPRCTPPRPHAGHHAAHAERAAHLAGRAAGR